MEQMKLGRNFFFWHIAGQASLNKSLKLHGADAKVPLRGQRQKPREA
jgi:hypothetical protein